MVKFFIVTTGILFSIFTCVAYTPNQWWMAPIMGAAGALATWGALAALLIMIFWPCILLRLIAEGLIRLVGLRYPQAKVLLEYFP